MSENLEGMRHKIKGVKKLESVVKTMKILAAANLSQYEQALIALEDYSKVVDLGLSVFFHKHLQADDETVLKQQETAKIYIVVFGSDQGLVGQFNDVLLNFTQAFLKTQIAEVCLWTVGERIYTRLEDAGIKVVKSFEVPNMVSSMTTLIDQILLDCEAYEPNQSIQTLYLIHNQLLTGMNYEPVLKRILPFDKKWQDALAELKWPTQNLPEILGSNPKTLEAFMQEEIFIGLFKACSHSLASENASRFASMQRAEKNIEEMATNLDLDFHQLSQKISDEEMFDVIAGAENL